MLGGAKQKVFVHLFQKVADSKDSVFGRTPQSAKHFVRGSAFAGEFFNPKLGLKKRGLL